MGKTLPGQRAALGMQVKNIMGSQFTEISSHSLGLLLDLIPVIHPLWRSLMFCYQNVITVLLSTVYLTFTINTLHQALLARFSPFMIASICALLFRFKESVIAI